VNNFSHAEAVPSTYLYCCFVSAAGDVWSKSIPKVEADTSEAVVSHGKIMVIPQKGTNISVTGICGFAILLKLTFSQF
jgi:hypothetical protein